MHNSQIIHWIAHRGDCESHIENTLESIQAAIDNGIDHIEIDIQLTRDRIPVVFHDDSLKRMFAFNTSMSEIDFTYIKNTPLQTAPNKKNLAPTYYIPTLLQVVALLKQAPHVTLYVEVKNINFSYFTYQTVYKKIIENIKNIITQVVIIGFSYRFLRYVQQHSALPIAYVLPSWRHYSKKMLVNLHPDIIFSSINIIPAEETFHTKEETWVVYETSTVEQAILLAKRGITHFESFTPALLKQNFIGVTL